MKQAIKWIIPVLALTLASCKDHSTGATSNRDRGDAASGQRIGSNADSTSVDGPPGNPSNH